MPVTSTDLGKLLSGVMLPLRFRPELYLQLAKHESQIMPRHSSFQDVPRLVLPVIFEFGNPNYEAGISHL